MDDWTKELPAKQGAAVRTLVSMQSRESIFGQANRFDGAVVGRTTGWLRAHPCPDLLSSRTTLRGFISSIPQRFNPRLFKPEVAVKGEISSWVQRAAGLESSGAAARSAGDERAAESHFREALDLAVKAVNRIAETSSDSTRLDVLHIA